MVRIPRSEQTVAFQPAMMPGTSGDAYAAPGRAMQGLGQAIAGLGDAFSAKANAEDDYNTKLKMLQWSNETDLESIQRQNTYTGDGTNYTADTQQWYKGREASLYDGMSETGKRKASLFLEQKRGTVVEGAQRFEFQKRNESIYVNTESLLTSEFEKLAQLPTEELQVAAPRALAGINAIIDQNPLGETAKERMREHARQLYEAAVIGKLPPGSRAESVKQMIETWGKTHAAPQTPGPQSGLNLPAGTIGAITDQSERKYNSSGYGEKLTGKITVNGNTYEFVNGGSKRGSIPHGNYEIQRYTSGEQRAKEGYSYTKDAFQLSDMADNAPGTAGDKRTGLLIHDGNRGVTAGCIGIKGDFQKFKADLQAEMARNGGKMKLFLGGNPGGQQDTAKGGGDGLRTSAAGIDTIKKFEGDKDQGWDYQQYSGPYGVKRGANEKLSLADAEDRLKKEVGKVEADIAAKIKGPLSQGQHDALVSLFYNIGTGKGRLDEVAGLINSGKSDQVPNWIRQYTKAGGEELPGLVKRRDAEAQMFAAGAGQKVASLGGAVPQPGAAEPEPSKITEKMIGTAEEKAAKLRDILGRGYQDVVHQLDADGNDVIVAKKASKPIWQRGRRGTNADGTIPNELDNQDFAGPGWANGVVEDLKAGKIQRSENTIPGNRVAEAPRLRPSVESKLVEGLIKKLPALKAQDEADVGKLVDRAEKVATEGKILPESERKAIERALQATGSKALMERYTLANMAAVETNMLEGARPDRIKDVAVGMRAEIAKAGGEATPEQLAKVKAVEAFAKHVEVQLETDMIGWGQAIGVIPQMPALDPGNPNPEALKAYAQAAQYMSQRYARAPVLFSKPQAEAIAERFKVGGAPMLEMLGKYAVGLGPEMMTVAMKQISPKAPEGAIAGYLYGNNINKAAARDIAETLHRRADPNYKRTLPSHLLYEPDAENVFGDTFRKFPPEQRDAILKAAEAIYENKAHGKKDYDSTIYKDALRAVIGERKDGQGKTYGGAVSQDGSWFGSGAKRVLLPPAWRQDTYKQVLETVSADDLMAAGLAAPVDGNGRAISAVRVANKGKLVQLSQGVYAVAMGDPDVPGKEDYLMSAPTNPREDRATAPRHPFVLDLNKLEPVLRKKHPRMFWSE